jgi:hypothetical protein
MAQTKKNKKTKKVNNTFPGISPTSGMVFSKTTGKKAIKAITPINFRLFAEMVFARNFASKV